VGNSPRLPPKRKPEITGRKIVFVRNALTLVLWRNQTAWPLPE
jgi:hypothetical protein